jgi:hypothetical protein
MGQHAGRTDRAAGCRITEPEGPTSPKGSAGGGPDMASEGVGEVGGVVVVRGASGL